MINRLKKLWKRRYKQGVISYRYGFVWMSNIKFDGVVAIVYDDYVELRKQGNEEREQPPTDGRHEISF